MLLSSLLPDLSDAVNVIGKLTENIKKAIEDGRSVYEAIQLSRVRQSLVAATNLMMDTNSAKSKNIDDLSDYLDNNVFKLPWGKLQIEWKKIASNLNQILEKIETEPAAFVQGAGFENAGDLKAALSRQGQIYDKLSSMEEPQNEADLRVARKIEEQLQALRIRVVALESAIDRYLRKFAP